MLLPRNALLWRRVCSNSPCGLRQAAGGGATRQHWRHAQGRPLASSSRRRVALAAAGGAEAEGGDVDVMQAMDLTESGAAVYLDCRTTEEYAAGRPRGSLHAAVYERGSFGMLENPKFLEQVAEAVPDRDTQLVVGCKSGVRSLKAQALLLGPGGYTSVRNVLGGFDVWAAAGLPVDK